MHGTALRGSNREQQWESFTKVMVGPKAIADHGHQRGNGAHGRKGRRRVYIDHQHGQYYEHCDCKRSTKPRDAKAKRYYQHLLSFSWLDEET